MNKIIAAIMSLSVIGCVSRPVMYSHTEKYDLLTVSSYGDNLSDYGMLRDKAQELCMKEGFKKGITVLDAHPSASAKDSDVGSYSMAYKCNEPSLTDQAVSAFKKIEEAAK